MWKRRRLYRCGKGVEKEEADADHDMPVMVEEEDAEDSLTLCC